ncbi:MAG: winged helix-turn-helix domain-containing protein [Candidatus Omnitrophica bacterium]|nr:winged helix-turn-helix domain-containing protein [Candidatus Omnitrophota bacterium]
MITEIGIVAGEIWHYLDKHGEARFSEMVTGIKQSRELALMSVGWLAREGHVVVKPEGNDYQVSLRHSS